MTPNTPEDVSDELERAQNLLRRAIHSETARAALGQFWVDDVSMLLGHSQLQRHRARTGYHANCPSCTCAFQSEEGKT
jgi:hypothetical protein